MPHSYSVLLEGQQTWSPPFPIVADEIYPFAPCETKPQLETTHTWIFEGFDLSAVTLASLLSLRAGEGTRISYKSGTSRQLIMLVFRRLSKCTEGSPSIQFQPRLDEDLFVFLHSSRPLGDIEDLLTPARRPLRLIYYGTSRPSKTSSNLQPPDLRTARRPLRLESTAGSPGWTLPASTTSFNLTTKWERPRSLS